MIESVPRRVVFFCEPIDMLSIKGKLWRPVTSILNVSRKFSMCIIFSTGYIKIYNINSSNEYFIQQDAFVQSTIQYNSSKT